MIDKTTLFCLSPTGGTQKVGNAFCEAFAKQREFINLLGNKTDYACTECETVVFAAPVFAGRVISVFAEKLKNIDGKGKKAITVAVYGNRAYEDALIEMNDIVSERGFAVIASGAFVAQHSLSVKVAEGRPDKNDFQSIHLFAKQVSEKLEKGDFNVVSVPGNRPYKQLKAMGVVPTTLDECAGCGKCAEICPVGAISYTDYKETNSKKCMLCMACVASCPTKSRVLPSGVSDMFSERLAPFESIRNKNEWFL